jgi:enoyl-CoA hydratase/carnithine racemase
VSNDEDVLFDVSGAAGIVTLNRPKALNALTHDMALAISTKLVEWAEADNVGQVVIRATGEKAFCAGGDVRRLFEQGKARDTGFLEFYHDEYQLNTMIKRYQSPYVAVVDGIVMGGGVGVSVHGSHRVMTEFATFAMPETGIGLFPDVGGTYFLPRCPGEIGMYLGLTGARLKVADAVYSGIATHFVPRKKLPDLLENLTSGGAEDSLAEIAEMPEPGRLAGLRDWIDETFDGESVEDIILKLENLDGDAGEWGQKTAAILATKSPTSLKITFRQIREGAKLDFEDCMRIEYRMVNRIFSAPDFFEGTRAIIIDKDNAPDWQPGSLGDVSDGLVDEFFANLGAEELQLPAAVK